MKKMRILLAFAFAAARFCPGSRRRPRSYGRSTSEATRGVFIYVGSLSLQRSSLEKQIGESKSGFFVLSPPASLGAAPAFAGAACAPLPQSEVDSLVENAARREDLDKAVLRGVMRQESAFRPCAVSPKGAMGLMQLMPATARQLESLTHSILWPMWMPAPSLLRNC